MSDLIVKVARIEEILPHDNADKLEIVKIFGWYTIVSKGEYKVGDLVTYVPIDAMFTLEKAKELGLVYMLNSDQTKLRSSGRVKTIKLRGYVSQGLILPAPEGSKEGDDVADFYEIRKYEEPAPKYQAGIGSGKSKKRKNVYFAEYTKAPNIKFYPDLFEDGEFVVITEKIHGTNSRFGKLPYTPLTKWEKVRHFIAKIFGVQTKFEFVYGSHRVQITGNSSYKGFYGEDIYGQIAKRYDMRNILLDGYTVYGEIFGEGIQDLTYGVDGTAFMVFDVMKDGRYLDYYDMETFCRISGLQIVPVLYIGEYYSGLVEEYTSGMSVLDGEQIREGIVIKPLFEVNDPRIGRKMLKSISDDYLLRKGGSEYH